jgi:hypothetical protein
MLEYKMNLVDNSYSFKRKSFIKQLDSIEVLILGSSQALQGVNPSELNMKGYNLASVSQSLYYDRSLSLKYANRLPSLKYVILFVSYFSLGYELFDSPESWRDYYYYQYWQVSHPKIDRWDIRCFSKMFLYTPKESLNYLVGASKTFTTDGFSPDGYLDTSLGDTSNVLTFQDGLERVTFHNSLFKRKYIGENKKYIEDIITGFRKHGVETILIIPPVNDTYSKNADTSLSNLSFRIISDLAKTNRCIYRNYFNDIRFSDFDFIDHDHLNSYGAKKLTRLINADLKNRD